MGKRRVKRPSARDRQKLKAASRGRRSLRGHAARAAELSGHVDLLDTFGDVEAILPPAWPRSAEICGTSCEPFWFYACRDEASCDSESEDDSVPTVAAGKRVGHDPPLFSPEARGKPADWNLPAKQCLFWGKKAYRYFDKVEGARPNIESFLGFLRCRTLPDGRSVLDTLGPAVEQADGWHCMPYKSSCGEELPSGWSWYRAWHGCKLEGLYSILYHGALAPSADEGRGERFLAGAPGVYAHSDTTQHKAEGYMRWVPLCNDGVFWATKFELLVDRQKKVTVPHKTDQWVTKPDGVRLVALWVCGRTWDDMCQGSHVAKAWDPKLEAHPAHFFA